MLVATTIMGIAVVGLLSSISTSLQHASRLTDYDRAALVAKHKMDELLLDMRLPRDTEIGARLDPALTGMNGTWRARVTIFEQPPAVTPGSAILERLELQVWWTSGAMARTLSLEAFRRATIPPVMPGGGQP
jgi:type II secretory pathway pseudopilin PulG